MKSRLTRTGAITKTRWHNHTQPAVGYKGKNMPWMRNPTLIPHVPIASVITILFLFHIAMLTASISARCGEMMVERKLS